jgi:hypothetical protein
MVEQLLAATLGTILLMAIGFLAYGIVKLFLHIIGGK